MANLNDRNSSRSEVRRETYQDAQGNRHTTVSQQERATDPRGVTPSEAAYLNEPNSYHQEVHRDTYRDSQGNLHTTTSRSENNVPPAITPTEASYRNGYVSGQTRERRILEEQQEVRDNDNAARGLLLGILLTSLVGLTVGSLALLAQRRNQPAPVAAPVIQTAPAPAASPAPVSPAPQTAPSTRTTVIERTREVVPVPQQRTIERVVPAPQPAPQTAPQTQQQTSPSSTTTTPGTIVVPDASSTPTNTNSDASQSGATTSPQGTATTPNITTGSGNP
ncbi:MAG: hypothetical protein SFW36_11235 [Leptolyngbyaceae cyanobacterium bins.59]|nr:hypothetical protein [Leptolyngbyaceae cyanobacterium bins.59]